MRRLAACLLALSATAWADASVENRSAETFEFHVASGPFASLSKICPRNGCVATQIAPPDGSYRAAASLRIDRTALSIDHIGVASPHCVLALQTRRGWFAVDGTGTSATECALEQVELMKVTHGPPLLVAHFRNLERGSLGTTTWIRRGTWLVLCTQSKAGNLYLLNQWLPVSYRDHMRDEAGPVELDAEATLRIDRAAWRDGTLLLDLSAPVMRYNEAHSLLIDRYDDWPAFQRRVMGHHEASLPNDQGR